MHERIDVDSPLWDQATFIGRFRHFAWMSNPINGLVSTQELESAKSIVVSYRTGTEPPGTTQEQVKHAMQLYRSAFHPDTGELQNIFGRMSFQMPGGMLITGAMLQFYRSVPAVVFWQWFNQSFNALVNYTNRNADSPTTTAQLGVAYTSATCSALATAIGLRKICERSTSTLIQRFVPFAAVASANCVNIPLMRQNELINGIAIYDEQGNRAGTSKLAAKIGISQVVSSRIVMAAPGMLVLPLIMEKMERKHWFKSRSYLHAPFQVGGVGCFLLVMVPFACALFPQDAQISAKQLKSSDPEAYERLETKYGAEIPQTFFYNKGL
ncbi:sideroflexin-2 [Eurytemora carolleeae]|uniref:sideroflexin-2 n=1 Tax=Eurytemora carolleeae TaxID=1294199 RepID=UPI000C7655FE|nr:sideroflexin-2 [Eurytemora carolleeae]|eukprot:XP_023346028.1 sideroflexin-2-like [Eurytemora affinis]